MSEYRKFHSSCISSSSRMSWREPLGQYSVRKQGDSGSIQAPMKRTRWSWWRSFIYEYKILVIFVWQTRTAWVSMYTYKYWPARPMLEVKKLKKKFPNNDIYMLKDHQCHKNCKKIVTRKCKHGMYVGDEFLDFIEKNSAYLHRFLGDSELI